MGALIFKPTQKSVMRLTICPFALLWLHCIKLMLFTRIGALISFWCDFGCYFIGCKRDFVRVK